MAARLPVDWDAIESSASDESLRAVLRELRFISEIADLHHNLPPAFPTGPSSSSPPAARGSREGLADATDTRTPQEAPKPKRWGTFTLSERVGLGSFGDVYRAWDDRLDREVALKLLRETDGLAGSDSTSIIDEGRLLARVHHPNVVTVYGADRIDGRVGLWMEFIHGQTLEESLKELGTMSETQVADIGVQVCYALAAVHQAGLLHRDIKAQNVMREGGGRLVLMDFGAGREFETSGYPADREVAGTPLYLAPEIFEGRPSTIQSDIYALGVLLYHLLTGGYPVTGGSIRAVHEGHRTGRRTAIREARTSVPEQLARVINRALAVNPSDRFDSADDMVDALAGFVTSETPGQATSGWRLAIGATAVTATASLIAIGLMLNVGNLRHRLFDVPGRPNQPESGRMLLGPTNRAFAVRQVMLPGEYSEVGPPSLDGRYLPFFDRNADVAVKVLETGQVRRLTQSSPEVGFGNGAAAVSPDSRWIAYAWTMPDGSSEVRVLPLDSQAEHKVVLHRKDEEVSPIAWSGDGSSILISINRKDFTGQVALLSVSDGTVRPIGDKTEMQAGTMSLSPDGRFLAYDRPQEDDPRRRDIYVLATDGTGTWPLAEHPANDLFPQWSADGERVVFASDRTGALGLWMIRVDGGHAVGEAEVISPDMGRMHPLGLTRDGRFYFLLRTGLVDAYTVPVDPVTGAAVGKPQPVAPNYIGSNISSTWSPDGRHVAYVSIRGVTRADRFSRVLSIRDIVTGKERDLLPALAFFIMPEWSPDGRMILVRGNDLKGRCCLQRIDVAQGRVTYIPLMDATATGHYQWQSNGKSIVFARNDIVVSRDLSTGEETPLADVRALGVNGLSFPPYGRSFALSPDGQSLAFSGWAGAGDDNTYSTIMVLSPGGVPVEIMRGHAGAPPKALIFQGWTPDGLDVFFTKAEKDQRFSLWRVPAGGGDPHPVGLDLPGLRDVHINRDGTQLTFTAGWETGEVRVMENFLKP
jgi:serine/threonine-protein kinase